MDPIQYEIKINDESQKMKFFTHIGFTFFLCIAAMASYFCHLFLTAIFSIFGNWLYMKTAFIGGIFIDSFHNFALFISFFISSFLLKRSSYYTVDRAFFYGAFSTLVSVWQIRLDNPTFGIEHLIVYSMPGLGIFLSFIVQKSRGQSS